MKNLTLKKTAIIVGCMIAAFVVNWLLWLLTMGHPDEIGFAYQFLTTLCLGVVLIVVADKFLKAEIFR